MIGMKFKIGDTIRRHPYSVGFWIGVVTKVLSNNIEVQWIYPAIKNPPENGIGARIRGTKVVMVSRYWVLPELSMYDPKEVK